MTKDIAPASPSYPPKHIPVMTREVLQSLDPKDNETYLDVTFGQGGHARAILKSAHCNLVASDRDTLALKAADALSLETSKNPPYKGNFLGCNLARFSHITETLEKYGVQSIDGLVADFGLSSPQLDTPSRGFSFSHNGPLDMRMGKNHTSAQQLIESSDEDTLIFIIKNYGEERYAKRIARSIIRARSQNPITTTHQLAQIVRSAIPYSHQKRDPATRTFQAIRIAVNSELDDIKDLLHLSLPLLKKDARIVIITFHSLEDRIVKHFFRHHSQTSTPTNRHRPPALHTPIPLFSLPFRKPITPSEEEISLNPRARSARLRLALRTHAPSC